MSDLPTDVLIEYNGFTWPVESEIVGVETIPIWDSAGRTITALTHEFTVRGIIWVDPLQVEAGVDATFDAIKYQLMRPAAPFTLNSTAWGNYEINPLGGGGTRDLMWGPKPQLIIFRHLGYKYSAKIT